MRKLLFFTLFATAFFACTDKVGTLKGRIEALEKEFNSTDLPDEKKANEFIATAEQLASMVEKSDSNLYVDLLIKAAGLAKTMEQPQKAIELYSKIVEKMPQHPKAPTAFFMLGFVYANDLKDMEKAKAAYELFLQKFPNDELAESARMELKNLGKSEEEIIKEFMQNHADSSKAVQ
jgi:tetratricopeptide (TPR) repeat protein